MLQINNITKKYDRTVLDKISITFPESGLFFVKGESGSGKTTLISIIAGLLKPDEGEIIYNNRKLSFYDMELFRKEHLSFLFQDYGIIDHFSIKDNLLLSQCILKKQSCDDDLIKILKKVGLNKSLTDKCFDLSGGEKQRLAVARILLYPKDIILLDEPSSSLDKENYSIIFSLLKELSKEKLIIIVSHNLDLISDFGEYVYDLKKKRYIVNNKDNKLLIKSDKKQVLFNVKCFFKLLINSISYRKFRYLISILTVSFIIIISSLSVLFSISFDNIKNESHKRFIDYNKLQISLNEKTQIGETSFNVISQSRPSIDQIVSNLNGYEYNFAYNIDYVFSSCEVINGDTNIFCLIKPVSFLKNTNYNKYEKVLDSMNEDDFLVNQSFYMSIKGETYLSLKTSFITYDNNYNYAIDNLIYHKKINIIDVVDEFEFMSVPTIYYHYDAWVRYLSNVEMKNASKLLKYNVTYYDRLSSLSNDKEEISSYVYDIYVNDRDIFTIKEKLEKEGLYVYSSSLETLSSMEDIFGSIEILLTFFVTITSLVGLFLIEMIVYSLIIDKKKEIGLINAYGVSKNIITLLFLCDIVFIFVISLMTSTGLLGPIIKLINSLIITLCGISNFIIQPHFLFFILLFFIYLLIGLACLIFPFIVVKKMDIKEILLEG